MKLIQIGASGVKGQKKTYMNLSNIVKIELQENSSLQLTWPGYFDMLSPEDQGYEKILELLKQIDKGEQKIEG